jgi:hypothetical protein
MDLPQALCKINIIEPSSHDLFSRIVDFSLKSASSTTKAHSSSEKVIAAEFPKLMNNQSLKDYIQSTLNTVNADPLSSLPMRMAVAKAMLLASVGTKDDALSLIIDSKLAGREVTVESCREALKFIESTGDDGKKEQLKMLVVGKFPFVKDL